MSLQRKVILGSILFVVVLVVAAYGLVTIFSSGNDVEATNDQPVAAELPPPVIEVEEPVESEDVAKPIEEPVVEVVEETAPAEVDEEVIEEEAEENTEEVAEVFGLIESILEDQVERTPESYSELYAIELAKLVPIAENPNYNRGEDPTQPLVHTVPANSRTVNFAGHVDITTPDGQSIYLTGSTEEVFRENTFVLVNSTDEPVEFIFKYFPQTGFSTWIYREGLGDLGELLAQANVGWSSARTCGVDNGCDESTFHRFIYDGQSTTVQTGLYDTPLDWEMVAAPVMPMDDLLSMAPPAAISVIDDNLSQLSNPVEALGENQMIYFGNTHDKIMQIELEAGDGVTTPDKQYVEMAGPAVVFFVNDFVNTEVFKVFDSDPSTKVPLREFRPGAEAVKAGPFLARYMLTQDDLNSVLLYVFTYDGMETFVLDEIYTEQLPESGS